MIIDAETLLMTASVGFQALVHELMAATSNRGPDDPILWE
jgi:hypothetical protein